MNDNLPSKIELKDSTGYATLELPQCVYCDKTATKENPIKEQNEEMICYSCATDLIEQAYFPTVKSEEAMIHESLMF